MIRFLQPKFDVGMQKSPYIRLVGLCQKVCGGKFVLSLFLTPCYETNFAYSTLGLHIPDILTEQLFTFCSFICPLKYVSVSGLIIYSNSSSLILFMAHIICSLQKQGSPIWEHCQFQRSEENQSQTEMGRYQSGKESSLDQLAYCQNW